MLTDAVNLPENDHTSPWILYFMLDNDLVEICAKMAPVLRTSFPLNTPCRSITVSLKNLDSESAS